MNSKTAAVSFAKLIEIVAQLRGPTGCPWDKEQSQKTLVQYAIEEAFELAEAIETNDQNLIKEELGDFLFQVVLQSQVAEDEKYFNLVEVIDLLNEKMIRRHPHVFESQEHEVRTSSATADSQGALADTAELAKPSPSLTQIWDTWEKIKSNEKSNDSKKAKPIFSYPKKLPALQAALKIGVKTERYRFDWSNIQSVIAKVDEEVAELKEAILEHRPGKDLKHVEHEIGDLLFVVSQLARHLKVDPEQALRECNRRFERRFNKLIELSQVEKEEFASLSENQKEKLWTEAKKILG